MKDPFAKGIAREGDFWTLPTVRCRPVWPPFCLQKRCLGYSQAGVLSSILWSLLF